MSSVLHWLAFLPRLTERAAIAGLRPQGAISWGGGSRLMPAADGWVALSLTRKEDVELVPALIGTDDFADPWEAVAGALAAVRAEDFVGRARLLGLPAARLGECGRDAVVATRLGDAPPADVADVAVADLSSLWAGPLCGALLADAGAAVTKIEAVDRPDGARFGPPEFFDRLNGGKSHIALAFHGAELREHLEAVDVVIEASRPRALEQLGIDACAMVAAGRPRVWVSITGYGRTGPERDFVAFGDDAAVAGGLVGWNGDQPVFCGDAIADPLTGIVAARAALAALKSGGRWLLDVAMAGVAARFAGRSAGPSDAVRPCRAPAS